MIIPTESPGGVALQLQLVEASIEALIETPNASGNSCPDTCPAGGQPNTAADDAPAPFAAGDFCIGPASGPDKKSALEFIGRNIEPSRRVFIHVSTPIDQRSETPREMRECTREAAVVIPRDQPGTMDDYGFTPFCDDTSTSRKTALAKIRARAEGTRLAIALFNG